MVTSKERLVIARRISYEYQLGQVSSDECVDERESDWSEEWW